MSISKRDRIARFFAIAGGAKISQTEIAKRFNLTTTAARRRLREARKGLKDLQALENVLAVGTSGLVEFSAHSDDPARRCR